MELNDTIYVAGHTGLVGSAIVRRLAREGFDNLITRDQRQLDLTRQRATEAFFADNRPNFVFLAAAEVGGIVANNSRPADFIGRNLAIQTNVIRSARLFGVRKLLFLGSSCIYPRDCPQPIKEEYLLSGPLEPTNAPYAVAKIAGITMCQAENRQHGATNICVMPTNLYGPNDNFDLTSSHVLPALMRKLHEARLRGDREVQVWGTGRPRREFLHVDDLADACLFLMRTYQGSEIVNIGVGRDLTIAELAQRIAAVVGFDGELRFDTSKPDGTPVKRLDVSRLTDLGWTARIGLDDGIRSTYRWFVDNRG